MTAIARLRRTYFDCRYGQLHVHQAIPAGGGFDEATALLCIPGSRGRGGFFQPLLASLGADRSVYAPDLPGCGESDSAGAGAGAAQYALAFADMLDSLRQWRVDVLAQGDGIHTAIALIKLRPGTLVHRCALSAAPAVQLIEARSLTVPIHELMLAGAADGAISSESIQPQLNDLMGFFATIAPQR